MDICIDCGEKNEYTGYRCKSCQSDNFREWQEENKEHRYKYFREKYENDTQYRLSQNLRSRIYKALKNQKKENTTRKLLGCSSKELKEHLENQFKENMTWDNYGEWHIDHIKPCDSFDLTDKEERRGCFHYTNLQPLWAEENLKKSNKI